MWLQKVTSLGISHFYTLVNVFIWKKEYEVYLHKNLSIFYTPPDDVLNSSIPQRVRASSDTGLLFMLSDRTEEWSLAGPLLVGTRADFSN